MIAISKDGRKEKNKKRRYIKEQRRTIRIRLKADTFSS